MQTDQKKWDYKHQVLTTRFMAPWRVLVWVKFTEMVMQLRPRSLWRLWTHPDIPIRDCIRWYYRIGRRVLLFEIGNFLDERRKHVVKGPTLEEFWGAPQDEEEESMQIPVRGQLISLAVNIPGPIKAKAA
jgi:anaerobic magnesium-protoporphyrin IX monomethyl ester cyclase